MYNRDLAGTRHSPLTQINTTNVATLAEVWSYKIGKDRTSGTLSGGSEVTPIVVNGVMYLPTADAIVALEPETGKEVWRYPFTSGAPSRRGTAHWPGDGNVRPRIFVTSRTTLIALDAHTGEPVSDFGTSGVLDMGTPYESAPTVYNDLLIVGTNASPGAVRAFSARTGAKVWEFRSVPQEEDCGTPAGDRPLVIESATGGAALSPCRLARDTWAGQSWRDHGGAIHWAFSMTLDVKSGMLYTVFDSPVPDYYGGNRHGNNLFGNSIVALEAQTGNLRWHFQTVHHDLWDYDLPAPPGLLDVSIDGQRIEILALAGKTGYMYLLDRLTGRPIFGIGEYPVPASDVPGERSSPTQPIPVKPPPIARVSFKPDEIVTAADTTAEHAAFCEQLVKRSGGLYNEGPFMPYLYRADGAEPRSTVLFPGSVGGANWGGTASDPSLGFVFVNTMDEASIGWIEKRADRDSYNRNSVVGPTSRFQWSEGNPRSGNILGAGERAWPCQKPPWGQLVAVNANTGDIAWKVPLGVTDELAEGKRNTGRLNFGGPITTASGLVFIGASNDHRFRAFDSRTGKELWVTKLEMSAHAVPITFQGKDGRQYVAVVAAGASAIDNPAPAGAEALVVFALP